MSNQDVNSKILNNVMNKIAISNMEMEERAMVKRRKRGMLIFSIVAVCFISSFATVNAMTNNALIEGVKETINKLFNKENISATYSVGENLKVHPITGQPVVHTGVDLRGEVGDPVLVVEDGEVIETGFDSKYGYYIKVKHSMEENVYTKYGHLSKIDVEVGGMVLKNEKIGEVGQSGMATGPHLHFEVTNEEGEYLDPNQYLN